MRGDDGRDSEGHGSGDEQTEWIISRDALDDSQESVDCEAVEPLTEDQESGAVDGICPYCDGRMLPLLGKYVQCCPECSFYYFHNICIN